MKKKKYFIPAMFSFFIIGLGQILKGHSDKGLKWLLFFYLFLPAIAYISLRANGYVFFAIFCFSIIFYPVFWIYNILDALFSEEE